MNLSEDGQKVKDELDMMTARLNKQAAMVEDIQKLSQSVALLANNMHAMLEEQKVLNTRLTELEKKPGKRWDSIIDKIVMLIVAALVGALLLKLGISA